MCVSRIVVAGAPPSGERKAAVDGRVGSAIPSAYTVRFEERVSRVGEPAVVSRVITEYRRADGSRAESIQTFRLDGTPDHTKRHIYLASQIRASIWDDLRVIVVQREAAGDPLSDTSRLDGASGCVSDGSGARKYDSSGPDEQIAGHRAVRLKPRYGGKAAESESWRIPSLGCLEGRLVAKFKRLDGVVTDAMERVATSIQAVAPPSHVFDLPRGYEQVAPSEAYRRMVTKLNGKLGDGDIQALQAADADYEKNKVDLRKLP